MIKFFRHIRKNLLMENKTSKYFKYAIGEIILVMIGILLALQVSNWNNQRKENQLEKRYLSDLILDLQVDSVTISNTKSLSDKQRISKQKVQSFYQGESIQKDSLISYFGDQYRPVPKFNPITTTLDEMKSTGNISVIRNSSVRRKILETYNYYSTHINNSQDRYLIQQNALGDYVQTIAPNIFSDILEGIEPVDIIALLNNFQVKNRFLGNSAVGFNNALSRLESRNSELLSILRKESKTLE